MVTPALISLALVTVVVLGVLAQWLAWRTRLPSILILLLTGFAVGPGVRWFAGPESLFLDPDRLFGGVLLPVVSLAVGVILYEGGLTLQLREIRDVGHVIRNLVTVGALVTWILTALLAHVLLDLSWSIAFLLGAILVVTGPTVIGPLLQQIRPQGPVGPVLKWEGIVIDPVGATLAVLVFDAVQAGQGPAGTLGSLALTLAAGVLLGLLGARLLVVCLSRHLIPDHLDNAASLAVLLAAYAAANRVHDESGLIAATVMGIALANQRTVPIHHVIEFKENLRVLLISGLFVVLAAKLDVEHLRIALEPGTLIFLVALILVVRPAAVWLSTLGSKLRAEERLFLACVAPRGIVAAAVASVFALRLAAADGVSTEETERLVAVTFLVIVTTVACYGLTAGPLAGFLRLAVPDPQGLLILGAHPGVRELASALHAEGFRTVVVDNNRANVAEAQRAGLEAIHANVLSEFVSEELDLGGVGRLLAMTPNDEVNALACQRFSDVFGRRQVYRLAPRTRGDARHDVAPAHVGRILFGDEETNQRLYARRAQGATLVRRTLADARPLDDTSELHLFLVQPGGELLPFTADYRPTPQPGAVLVSLAQPDGAETRSPAMVGSTTHEEAEVEEQ